jgi:sulfofructose kinase
MTDAARKQLLCVGHASIDIHLHVEHVPAPPAKIAARTRSQCVGGMSANAATAAARLGARVSFAGPTGDDEAADVIAAHFAAEGITPCGLVRVAGTSSSVSTILIDSRGERLIVAHRGEALQRPPPFDAGWLDGIDLVLVDPRCPAWAEAALRLARERGVPAILDADVAPRADLQRLATLAPWVVFSEPGLAAFGDAPAEELLAQVLAAGATHAVVTRGERGQLWHAAGGACRHMPAHTITSVVDTTGAGDVFHGALGVALAEGRPPDAALHFAAVAAALKCGHAGGVTRAPTRAELDGVLRPPCPGRSAPAPN